MADAVSRVAGAVHARLRREPLDAGAVLRRVRGDGDGAVCAFVGHVRDHSENGAVSALEYEAYAEMAEPLLGRIAGRAAEEAGATAVAVEHRTGRLAVGEAAVVVAAAAPHRAEAFAACREVIESLKREGPIWKREEGPGGAIWVEPPGLAAAVGDGGSAHSPGLSHLAPDGTGPRMIDVSAKEVGDRRAVARAVVRCDRTTAERIAAGRSAKGDVLATARIAGIMAAKRTAELIPLCHPLPLTHVDVAVDADAELPGIRLEASVRCAGRTGVEMEALTAVTVAGLTVIDMAKSSDRWMTLEQAGLVMKEGGRSGRLTRPGGLRADQVGGGG